MDNFMDELLKLMVQSSGAAAVALIAFYYGNKHYQSFIALIDSTQAKFNKTIQVHLRDAVRATRENAKSLQEFSDTNKNLREILEKVYIQNKVLYDENQKLSK